MEKAMEPGKLVMVVEDDLDIRESILELLADFDIPTCSASNGSEAISLLNQGTRPSVILLDLMMPIMDGYRFREAQGKDPELAQIPVVIMSADGHAMEKQTKINAAAFIKKPLDIDRLVQTLQTHWV